MRVWVAALLVANLVFAAWSQGWLDDVVGVRATGDREPERLALQVRPDTVAILSPTAVAALVSSAASSARSGEVCLQAGPFNASQMALVDAAAAAALPAGSWATRTVEQPGEWMVYMGKYPGRDTMAKKEEELKRTRLPYEEVKNAPAYEPGFSLGKFNNRADADAALAQFVQRGVRTAKVIELMAPSTGQALRIDNADPALAEKAQAFKVDGLEARFAPCPPVVGG